MACNVEIASSNHRGGVKVVQCRSWDVITKQRVKMVGMVRLGCNCPGKVWGGGTQVGYEANEKVSSDLLPLVHIVHRVIRGIGKVRLASPRLH